MKYTVEHSTYIYCVVCYCEVVAPYVRSVGHVFAYLYTLDDDSEHPMDYETSLIPKVFSLHCGIHIWCNVLNTYQSSGISVPSLINTFGVKPSNCNNVTTNQKWNVLITVKTWQISTFLQSVCQIICITAYIHYHWNLVKWFACYRWWK